MNEHVLSPFCSPLHLFRDVSRHATPGDRCWARYSAVVAAFSRWAGGNEEQSRVDTCR
jgi:hypothetical protein